jgi:phenylacetate-CoA ligase
VNEWFAKHVVHRFVQFSRGEKIFNYLKKINHIPYLPSDKIKEMQLEKLRKTLRIAYHNTSFYRRLFDEAGIEIENLRLPDDFKAFPTLSKDMVRVNYSNIINQNIRKRVSKELTSGSSGNPLTVVKDRDKSAYGRAVMYRCYNQYGIEIGHKQARFWGVPISPKYILKEKIKDEIANRIRLSAFDIHEKSLIAFTTKLKNFKPRYFYGYPSVLHKYATWILEKGYDLKELNLLAIITTGEVLYNFQREAIESAFKCKVVNEYGCTEIGILAFECSEGNLHIMADNVYLESVKSDNSRNTGEIVVTELNNEYNPLLRYNIGDMGAISENSCTCGINFPVISSLAGRDSTFIVTPEGRYINDAILEYTFAQGIKQFRAVQNSKELIDIKIVRRPELTDTTMEEYKRKLVKYLGTSIQINYEFVPDIEPDESGKLRYFISNIA